MRLAVVALHEVERRALVGLLRHLPNTTLAELCAIVERGDDRAALLGAVTISELTTAPTLSPGGSGDPGDPSSTIDRVRLHRAEQSAGEQYDALVHEVLREAASPVAAAHLRARVGGPRWKLQTSLGRLENAGKVARRGMTSGTRYWAVSEDS